MSTPVSPAQADESATLRPSPIVRRVYGEPRFHTDGDVAAVAFDSAGNILSIDESGLLQRWTVDGKLLSRQFLSDLETLWSFGPGAAVLASGNDDLLLWDVGTAQLLNRIPQDSWVTAIAFSPDGRVVASGHDNGCLRFWDVASYKFLGEITAHTGAVSAIAFAPSGDQLASAGEDRVVRVWDDATHKKLADLQSHTDRVPALAWSPDGNLLISAGWDTSARVWHPRQSDPLMLLNSHADQVHTLAFSPDGRYLACADSDYDIYLWTDPITAKVRHVLRGHVDEIRTLAFSADGTKLVSAGADRVIRLWDVCHGELMAGPNSSGRHALAVIPGPTPYLASTHGDTLRVWSVDTGEEVMPSGRFPAYSVAASPDGQWLAIGGTDHFTQLWHVPEARRVASLEATKPPIGAVCFSADSQRLAHTSPADGLVWVWKCASAEPELILIEAADGCTLEGIAFHPNGNWIACGGIDYLSTGERDGAVCVWDLTSREKRIVFDVGVNALAFDPAGKYLAGAALNDTVVVWDLDTEETVFELAGHQQPIHALCFDPTGSYLVSGSDDMTVRVWDVLSGRLLVARELDSPVQALSFSSDGRFLYCGNGNTTCYQIETKRLLND